tara:strand:+ start:2881 stop:3915 length:1035 start_codon:yes stop_codon:yes gene_type:complete
MKFSNVALESIDYALPSECWTSEFLEEQLSPIYERLKLPKGRLEFMTGIRERRFWPADTLPSAMAASAAEKLLAKSSLSKDKIDLLVHGAVCRDRMEPATAAYVHGQLGLGANTQIFDVSNACLGVLNGVTLAASMIESGAIKTALIVSGENGRQLIESTLQQLLNADIDRQSIKPFFSNLTIGAGAVALLLCHKDLLKEDKPLLTAAVVQTDSSHNHLCEGGNASEGGLEMQTDSEGLLEAGISLAQKNWGLFKQETGWNEDTPERIICHQVGKQHAKRLYEALSLDVEKDFSTFETLGNTGSAALPITLATALETGAIQSGDAVALLGIGSGLSSIMLALQA